MLGAEADEDDAALADLELHHGSALFKQLGAFEVAADENLVAVFRVSGDDAAVEARVGHARLEGGRAGEVGGFDLAHAVGDGMGVVHLEAKHGAGTTEGISVDVGEHVGDGELEEFDEIVGGGVEGDDGAALLDPLLDVRCALLAKAACVFSRQGGEEATRGPAGHAVFDDGVADVGEEQNVNLFFEGAVFDFLVAQVGIGEFVALQQPARPALVHAGDPGLVEADAGGGDLVGFTGGGSAQSANGDVNLGGEGGELAVIHLVGGQVDVADLSSHRGLLEPVERFARFQEPVDGGEGGVGAVGNQVAATAGGDVSARPVRRVNAAEAVSDGNIHLDGFDPHGNGQRPGSDVVGRDDGSAGVGDDLGIALAAQHFQNEGAIRLRGEDDVGAGAVAGVSDREAGLGPVDADAVAQEEVNQPRSSHGVVLVGRDQEGVRRFGGAALDALPVEPVEIG